MGAALSFFENAEALAVIDGVDCSAGFSPNSGLKGDSPALKVGFVLDDCPNEKLGAGLPKFVAPKLGCAGAELKSDGFSEEVTVSGEVCMESLPLGD